MNAPALTLSSLGKNEARRVPHGHGHTSFIVVSPGSNTVRWAIAGDFNDSRCPKKEQTAQWGKDERERTLCDKYKAFWTKLTDPRVPPQNGRGYVDSIFDRHGLTNESITHQYTDGWEVLEDKVHQRGHRIDMIFARIPAGIVQASSHDLSCGYSPPDPGLNCDERNNSGVPTNNGRYSDHRLLWSLVTRSP